MTSVEAMQEVAVPPSEVIRQPDGSIVELTDIPCQPPRLAVAHNRVLRKPQLSALGAEERGTLLSLCYELFVQRWREVMFGPCIQGAVFELKLASEPTQVSYLDGYLTVFLGEGPSHLHLCLGAHQGLKQETPAELAKERQCGRAAFARTLGCHGEPSAWSVQLWNGAGEQMITFFLPSPYLDLEKQSRLRTPELAHLDLWNDLRARYLGEARPQPLPQGRARGTCS